MRTKRMAYVIFPGHIRNQYYDETTLNVQREHVIDVAVIAQRADYCIISDVMLNSFFFINDEKFSKANEERRQQYHGFLMAQFNLAFNLMCRCDELWIFGDVQTIDAVEEIRWFHRLHKPVRYFDSSGNECFSHLNEPLGVNPHAQ